MSSARAGTPQARSHSATVRRGTRVVLVTKRSAIPPSRSASTAPGAPGIADPSS